MVSDFRTALYTSINHLIKTPSLYLHSPSISPAPLTPRSNNVYLDTDGLQSDTVDLHRPPMGSVELINWTGSDDTGRWFWNMMITVLMMIPVIMRTVLARSNSDPPVIQINPLWKLHAKPLPFIFPYASL